MSLKVTATLEVEIGKNALTSALFQQILKDYLDEDFDDAGCDLQTDFNGNSYCGGETWQISTNKACAALIDAYNVLKYGKALKLRPWLEDKVQTIVVGG